MKNLNLKKLPCNNTRPAKSAEHHPSLEDQLLANNALGNITHMRLSEFMHIKKKKKSVN